MCRDLRQVFFDPALWTLLNFHSPSELKRDNFVLGSALRYLSVCWHSSRVKVCNIEDWVKTTFQKDICSKHESTVSDFLGKVRNKECLVHLFSFLDKESRKQFSETCRDLRQVFFDPALWTLLNFHSPSELKRDNFVLGSALRYLSVCWHSSRVKVCNIEDWVKTTFQKDICSKHESTVSDFLSKVSKSRCPNLLSLTLSGCGHVTDHDVTLLLQSCPRLRILRLENCVRLTDCTLQALTMTSRCSCSAAPGCGSCAWRIACGSLTALYRLWCGTGAVF
ncbi:UNVERIFIED_CONTAM: hypothetical protein FKN15_073711 [Acipenser sinensis]